MIMQTIIIIDIRQENIMKFEGQMKEVDIVKKYFKYPEFKKQLDEIESAYQISLNMSLYSNLTQQQKMKVFQIVPEKPTHTYLYINFYGYRMPASEENSQKIFLLWIRHLDELLRNKATKSYIILYYHTMAESTYPYAFLKGIFKKLPIQYYARLQNIYIVEPTIMLKSVGLFDFGRLHKIFTRRLVYVDTILEVSLTSPFQKDKITDTLPQLLKSTQSAQNTQKQIVQTSQQLKPLGKRDFLTIQLKQHKFTEDGTPICLQILFQTLKANPNMLKLQGIFRKSGSIEEEEIIIAKLATMNKVQVLDNNQFTGYSIAGIIKKFFTKLLIPIISYQIYNKILNTTQIRPQEEAQFVRDILNELPQPNKRIFLMMITFLREQVIPLQQDNKMNNYNMSVVFCPCFFRPENPSLNDLMNSGRYAGILNILFNKFQEIVNNQQKTTLSKRQSKGRKSRGSRGEV